MERIVLHVEDALRIKEETFLLAIRQVISARVGAEI